MNLGCGSDVREGWTNADYDTSYERASWEPEVVLWDFVDHRVPIDWVNDPFDLIVMNHSLQQTSHDQVPFVLERLLEILTPGGCLRVLVPDALAAFHAYESGYPLHFHVVDEHEPTLDGKFCAYLSQAGTARSFFTRKRLHELLFKAGYERPNAYLRCGETDSEHKEVLELDSRCDESLIAEGFKLDD